ncbi:MAG: hypothetical protein A3C43_06985 [Candidatus Schekmanbacteria bacterium RIFCSPHIGHO2_02_FULL_38_11]|uniref:Uncharacterized protein n=1 Tax=Candidatus Schekmanbacteria bacterium RIFCSPLOWO2_12_FULL_38_15 TaxID=1817883 RepID=A0A1F7SDI2_9BACT|nr:MAG: hypothetical protein A2043_01410 [Candidatus Schekmanbacteria bacterium GWA2_38_9]OGL48255.1 MAG: hypothetical protein A3H37_02275 [Candidatus Schekmanbacteria bacterium RIFCSPLOWO2_02_FULL_38_14]OGL51294.1 MAG: hypothetical protein A3G31_00945 [Candidatus Schekmanbacteria bacterium RIFCSPLOWO2_12_FULL_38_15]OGL55603.1 MAG: hypothetical protein A3C43_06985 [Candidatus Schekmanbacteria bacterium RIFCSPHIGHO2_02_FULL_38_11]
MFITRDIVGEKILQYINRKISLAELVNWAETAVCEGEFEEKQLETIRDILGHIGLSDVKEFGLTWDDCYEYLEKLGFHVNIEATKIYS